MFRLGELDLQKKQCDGTEVYVCGCRL